MIQVGAAFRAEALAIRLAEHRVGRGDHHLGAEQGSQIQVGVIGDEEFGGPGVWIGKEFFDSDDDIFRDRVKAAIAFAGHADFQAALHQDSRGGAAQPERAAHIIEREVIGDADGGDIEGGFVLAAGTRAEQEADIDLEDPTIDVMCHSGSPIHPTRTLDEDVFPGRFSLRII